MKTEKIFLAVFILIVILTTYFVATNMTVPILKEEAVIYQLKKQNTALKDSIQTMRINLIDKQLRVIYLEAKYGRQ